MTAFGQTTGVRAAGRVVGMEMSTWLAVVPRSTYESERLYHRETIGVADGGDVAPGDLVVLVADGDEPILFGLGQMRADLRVRYRTWLFDTPLLLPSVLTDVTIGTRRIPPGAYQAVLALIGPVAGQAGRRRDWHVMLHLPIEANTPAGAVREFWTYVEGLGPGELPTLVYPSGDELAMRAYVGGAPVDPDQLR
jgi:hypothetical protein